MAEQETLTPEEGKEHLVAALQLFGLAQATVLKEYGALHARRAERVEAAEARLAGLGEDHPRVVALRRAGARSAALRQELGDDAARTAKVRALKPYEWMVYGQVVDAAGKPVRGAVVRVYDKDRKLDDLLGETATDKYGDFQLVYHERAFHEPGEGAPELYVQVEDRKGKVLHTTEDAIRAEGGRVEHFVIELGAARKPGKGQEAPGN